MNLCRCNVHININIAVAKVTKVSVIGNQHFCGLKTSDIVIYVLLKKKVPES